MDILLPLAAVSTNDFLELKLALRSIAKCSDVGNIYVITTGYIPWLQNVTIVPIDDPIEDNKDKNLIRKIHLTLQKYPEIHDFVLWMDDFIVTKPISLNDLPDVYNNRGKSVVQQLATTKWHRRLLFTLTVMGFMGKDVSCNWDSHTPMRLNREKILAGLSNTNYMSDGADFTLFTLLANLCDKKRGNGVLQDFVKCTCETNDFKLNWDKLLLGYNDSAFYNGLKEVLLEKFPEKSKYEISTIAATNTVTIFAANVSEPAKLAELVNNTDKHVLVFPFDKDSVKAVREANVGCIETDNLANNDRFTIAKLMSKFCILYDGNYTYQSSYINDCLSDTIDTTALIYEPDKHKGIVNNTLLDKDILATVNNITDLFTIIDTLADTVTPSIIIKDEPEKL